MTSTSKHIDCYFDSIQVQTQGPGLPPKLLTNARASIQGNNIYLGSTSQFSIKMKDVTELHLDDNDDDDDDSGTMIRITSVKGTYTLQQSHLQQRPNHQYQQFVKRLQSMYEKATSTRDFTGFLETSSKRALGRYNHRGTTRAAASASSHEKRQLSPVRERGRQQPRATFGRVAALRRTNHVPLWDDDTLSPRRRVVVDKHEDLEVFPHQDEEQQSPRRLAMHHDKEPKQRGKMPVPKKRKYLVLSDQEEDDQDPFASSNEDADDTLDPSLTTPAAQRVVSPAGGTDKTVQPPEDDKTAMTTSTASESSSPDKIKGQQTLSLFFPKKQKPNPATSTVSSFDPATRYSVANNTTTTAADNSNSALPQTPERRRLLDSASTDSNKRLAYSAAKSPNSRLILQQRQQHSPTRALRQSSDWLTQGRTTDPKRSFGQQLSPALSPPAVSSSNWRLEDPSDPIQDNADDKDDHVHDSAQTDLLASPLPSHIQRSTGLARRKGKSLLLSSSARNLSMTTRRLPYLYSSNQSSFMARFSPHELQQERLFQEQLLQEPEVDARRNVFRGVRNLGNTCYVSASLQMMCTMPSTILKLQQQLPAVGDNAAVANDANAGTLKAVQLTRSVVAVAKQLQNRHATSAVNPQAVKQAMDAKTDKFVGYEQRDAHEFLSDLVDYMHEELVQSSSTHDDSTGSERITDSALTTTDKENADNAAAESSSSLTKSDAPPSPPTKAASPMDDFLCTLRVCLTCQSCGYARSKEETYRHLSLDIIKDEIAHDNGNETGGSSLPKPPVSQASVEKSLAHFFQPEVREIKCEKCDHGTHAMQTLQVVNRPKALLLHLKRFIFVEKRTEIPETNSGTENQPPNSPSASKPKTLVEYVFQKNKAPVCLTKSLTLEPFQVKRESTTGSPGLQQHASEEYHLKSIVHHIGIRASSGHYTADAVRPMEADILAAAMAADDTATSTTAVADKDAATTTATETTTASKELTEGWVTFDDTSSCITTLEKITSSRNKQSTAYMLLYALD